LTKIVKIGPGSIAVYPELSLTIILNLKVFPDELLKGVPHTIPLLWSMVNPDRSKSPLPL
jgi:hypothetical protein